MKLEFKTFSIASISLWLSVFALLPLLMVCYTSLLSSAGHLTIANYAAAIEPLYLHIFFRSFYLAGIATALCLLLAFPFALALSKVSNRYRSLLLLLIFIPFWTSSLVRTYAMVAILKSKGIINSLLLALGLIHQPLQLLFTNFAVVIGLTYNLLPFMIMPIYTSLIRIDEDILNAAKELGASDSLLLRKIIIPLSMPGIISGCILVFLPAMTLFYIPNILGGAKSMMLGNLIQNQFLQAQNWPLGSALSVCLGMVMLMMLLIYWCTTLSKRREAMQ